MAGRSRKKGILLVLSAPSGCGKTTVMRRLRQRCPNVKRSISMTTRPCRRGEHPGRDYIFVSEAKFLQERRKGRLLEWARVFGRYYGTPRDFVVRELERGRDVVLTIDVQGAFQIRRKMPESILVFLLPPSLDDLQKRLEGRQTEERSEMLKRLRRARRELRSARNYDYCVINRSVTDAVGKLLAILETEKLRRS